MQQYPIYKKESDGAITGEDQPNPSTLQNNEILYAQNETIYTNSPYQQKEAETDRNIVDFGYWVTTWDDNSIDAKWEVIKESINDDHFYECSVKKVDEIYYLRTYSLCFRDIPNIIKNYNSLAQKNLIDNGNVRFQAHAQVNERGDCYNDKLPQFIKDYHIQRLLRFTNIEKPSEAQIKRLKYVYYLSDDLPELLIEYMKEQYQELKTKNALSLYDLSILQNRINVLSAFIEDEKNKNTNAATILGSAAVKKSLEIMEQLPDKVLDFCKFERDHEENFLQELTEINALKIRTTSHVFFELDPVNNLLDSHFTLINSEPDYLLKNLRYEIKQLGENDFSDALTKLEKELSSFVQKQKNKHIATDYIMESSEMKCLKATLDLISKIKNNDASHHTKLTAIQRYEENYCNHPLLIKIAKVIACVVITAIGFVLGAAIGTVVGWLAGAWSGPGAAATAALGLATGAMKGAAIGLKIAAISLVGGTAVTGISSAVLSGYCFFKPSSSRNVVNKAIEHIGPAPVQIANF